MSLISKSARVLANHRTRTERKPRHIFRVRDLPFEVDPSTTTATLQNELLEIVMPKVATGVKEAKANAASPGR
jgi:HSP20 family molecular chaperone IbpA